MKNENIQKINTIGKVSRIIINITQIFLLIGVIATIIGGIICLAIPNDTVEVNGVGSAQVIVDDNNIFSFVDFENVDVTWSHMGMKVKYNVTENKLDDGRIAYDISAGTDGLKTSNLKVMLAMTCFMAAFLAALYYAVLIFAKKLAKTLEKCESPFEQEVLRRMKHFGIALIPWAVICVSVSGASGISVVLIAAAVLLFAYIFNYGAQLQKESDETL